MTVYAPWNNATYPYNSSDRLYGTGSVIDAPSAYDFKYKITLTDSTGAITHELSKYVQACDFTFKRYGGCDTANIVLRADFDDWASVENDRVNIFINSHISSDYTLVWQGYISDKTPMLDNPELVQMRAIGYVAQLDHSYCGKYQAIDVLPETVIKDILTSVNSALYWEIVLNTDITIDGTYIDAPATVPELVTFQSTKLGDAISLLAQLAGDYVWGVRPISGVPTLYFKAPSTTVIDQYVVGKDVMNYNMQTSYEALVNRLYIPEELETYENEADLTLDSETSASPSNYSVNVGDNATIILKQTFTTAKKSISRITLKPYGTSSDYSGTGYTELVLDGDMNDAGTASWNTTGTGNEIDIVKEVDLYRTLEDGVTNRSMKVRASRRNAGLVQQISITSGMSYDFSFSYKIIKGKIRFRVYDLTTYSVIYNFESEDLTYKDNKGKWADYKGNFMLNTGGIAGVHNVAIQWVNIGVFKALFYIDNVSVKVSGSQLGLYLVDDADPIDTNTLEPKTFIAKKLVKSIDELSVPVAGETNPHTKWANVNFDTHFYGADDSGITNYAIILKKENVYEASVTTHFKFVAENTGNLLYYYDILAAPGDEWVLIPNKTLYYKIYYNDSQENYGLYEEQGPTLQYPDIADYQNYANAYLSSRSEPWERFSYTMRGRRSIIETGVETSGLGQVAVRYQNEDGGLHPMDIDQITYSISDDGLITQVNAGKALPDIARLLKRIQYTMEHR